MTATDELHRLLDERGVEYRQAEWIDDTTIKWRGSDGSEYSARNGLSFDGPTGGVVLYDLTPEQAVEATLGRGTCRNVITDGTGFKCSECQAHISAWMLNEFPRFNYCPNCGRKVRA